MEAILFSYTNFYLAIRGGPYMTPRFLLPSLYEIECPG